MIDLKRLKEQYRTELLHNVMPFWYKHALDREYGGYMDYLDREGRHLSTDKGGWVQGRGVWMFSTLYRLLDPSPKWLEAAGLGVRFIHEKMITKEGRVWFELTREGRPLVMRRYLFTEMFAAMGLAEFATVSGDTNALITARELYQTIDSLAGTLPAKIQPDTRQSRSHSHTMMMVNVCQVLREADPTHRDSYTTRIDRQIDELFTYFVKTDQEALLETVNSDGSIAEGTEGRCINPGHAIETAWFILTEARLRSGREREDFLRGGLSILDWHLRRGWDDEYGGLFSFVDLEGRQPAQVEWDMKYFWPHCEATYATLLACRLTGDIWYERWFRRLHDYTWTHFPDPKYGEWFGYLRRDGSVSMTLKGNHWKGPFHIPRFLLYTYLLLDEIDRDGAETVADR